MSFRQQNRFSTILGDCAMMRLFRLPGVLAISFIKELKRRNVFRVGVSYTLLGWIVVEVTDTVAPALNMPDWTLTVVTWFGIIGFPFVLIFAWAFELTPEGIKRDYEVEKSQSFADITGRQLDYAIIGLLLLGVGFLSYDKFVLSPGRETVQPAAIAEIEDEQFSGELESSGGAEKSIAVLPFTNMSGDPEQEYFGDGIAEEILNGLAQVPGLRVVARTSAFSFKGQNVDIRHIGKTLNANHVLEGSVRKAEDQLRITAQLISVKDGYHLWSETYSRKIDDVFAIQEEIARAVTSELEVRLGFVEEASLVQPGTNNTEAYNWFLRGNFYIERQTPDAFDKAIESYANAIELDPDFAGGYGGLAYGLGYNSNFSSYLPVAERVRQAYKHALAIDENQTHALLARAINAVLTDYDYMTAENAVRRALTVGVNTPLVTDAYWWLVLAPQRRFPDALEYLAIAEKTDPLSSLIKQGIGFNLAWSGNYEASVPYLKAAIELNPNDNFAAWLLCLVYIELDRMEEAEHTIKLLEQLEGSGRPETFSSQARALFYIAQEDSISAHQLVEQMVTSREAGNKHPFLSQSIGIIYVHLGLIEEAVTWFEMAVETPSPFNSLSATFFHGNAAVWDHPRFQALMKRVHLDDASVATAIAAAAD